MEGKVKSITELNAWKDLKVHFEKMRGTCLRATGRRALGRMKQTVTRMHNAPAAVKGGAEGRPKQTLHVLPGSPSRQS